MLSCWLKNHHYLCLLRVSDSTFCNNLRLNFFLVVVKDTGEDRLELSFEYLMAKDKLQWISICSPQAILISVCLQAIVDELLLQKVGGNIKEVGLCG